MNKVSHTGLNEKEFKGFIRYFDMRKGFWGDFFEALQFGFGFSFGIVGIFGMISSILTPNLIIFILSTISFGIGLSFLKNFLD